MPEKSLHAMSCMQQDIIGIINHNGVIYYTWPYNGELFQP